MKTELFSPYTMLRTVTFIFLKGLKAVKCHFLLSCLLLTLFGEMILDPLLA